VTDKSSSEPRGPSDADVQVALGRAFDGIERQQAAISEGSFWQDPHPRSQMYVDDGRTAPLQLSHSVQTLISVAIEHQHAVVALVRDAKVLHNYAPFTLTRSAVEAAATAHWMLRPTQWKQRVLRLIIYQRQDRYDQETVARLIRDRLGGDLRPSLANRKRWLDELAARHHISDLPRKLEITDVIQDVDAAIDGTRHIETYWRTASGFAHGRQWAVMDALVHSEVIPHERDPSLAKVRLESSLTRVLWGLASAAEVTDGAIQLYSRACQAPGKR